MTSSPTRSVWTEGSFHGSSQYAAAEEVQDTAISVASVLGISENVAEANATSATGAHTMPGSIAMVSSNSPIATFQRNQLQGRSCSVSPILQRVRSPIGLSVAQRHVQFAK